MARQVPRTGHKAPRMGHKVPRMGYKVPRMGYKVPRMGHKTPPGWDQSHSTGREPSQPTLEEPGQVAFAEAQLLAYAQDLARAYATQKLMAQYLPADLRNRIIQGRPHVGGERRYVTVLFAELAGFTRLASRLDAEELFSLM